MRVAERRVRVEVSESRSRELRVRREAPQRARAGPRSRPAGVRGRQRLAAKMGAGMRRGADVRGAQRRAASGAVVAVCFAAAVGALGALAAEAPPAFAPMYEMGTLAEYEVEFVQSSRDAHAYGGGGDGRSGGGAPATTGLRCTVHLTPVAFDAADEQEGASEHRGVWLLEMAITEPQVMRPVDDGGVDADGHAVMHVVATPTDADEETEAALSRPFFVRQGGEGAIIEVLLPHDEAADVSCRSRIFAVFVAANAVASVLDCFSQVANLKKGIAGLFQVSRPVSEDGAVAALSRMLRGETDAESSPRHTFTAVETDASGTATTTCHMTARRAAEADDALEHDVMCGRRSGDFLQWADPSVAAGVPLSKRAAAEQVEYEATKRATTRRQRSLLEESGGDVDVVHTVRHTARAAQHDAGGHPARGGGGTHEVDTLLEAWGYGQATLREVMPVPAADPVEGRRTAQLRARRLLDDVAAGSLVRSSLIAAIGKPHHEWAPHPRAEAAASEVHRRRQSALTDAGSWVDDSGAVVRMASAGEAARARQALTEHLKCVGLREPRCGPALRYLFLHGTEGAPRVTVEREARRALLCPYFEDGDADVDGATWGWAGDDAWQGCTESVWAATELLTEWKAPLVVSRLQRGAILSGLAGSGSAFAQHVLSDVMVAAAGRLPFNATIEAVEAEDAVATAAERSSAYPHDMAAEAELMHAEDAAIALRERNADADVTDCIVAAYQLQFPHDRVLDAMLIVAAAHPAHDVSVMATLGIGTVGKALRQRTRSAHAAEAAEELLSAELAAATKADTALRAKEEAAEAAAAQWWDALHEEERAQWRGLAMGVQGRALYTEWVSATQSRRALWDARAKSLIADELLSRDASPTVADVDGDGSGARLLSRFDSSVHPRRALLAALRAAGNLGHAGHVQTLATLATHSSEGIAEAAIHAMQAVLTADTVAGANAAGELHWASPESERARHDAARVERVLLDVFAADSSAEEWSPVSPPLSRRLAVVEVLSERRVASPQVARVLGQQLRVLADLHEDEGYVAAARSAASQPARSPRSLDSFVRDLPFGSTVHQSRGGGDEEGSAEEKEEAKATAFEHAVRRVVDVAPCALRCLDRWCPADAAAPHVHTNGAPAVHNSNDTSSTIMLAACREDCVASCHAAVKLEVAILRLFDNVAVDPSLVVDDVSDANTAEEHVAAAKEHRERALAASSHRRRLISATLIDIEIGSSDQWHKVWGGSDLGVTADIDLTNLAQLRIGLFGGLFDLNINDEGRLAAYAWGWDFTIAHARIAFRAGFSYKSLVPADLLKLVSFVADNIAAGAKLVGKAYASALGPFNVSLEQLLNAFRDYVVPLVAALADKDDFIDTVFSFGPLQKIAATVAPKLQALVAQKASTSRALNATLRLAGGVSDFLGGRDVTIEVSSNLTARIQPAVQRLLTLAGDATDTAGEVFDFVHNVLGNATFFAVEARDFAAGVLDTITGVQSMLADGDWFAGIARDSSDLALLLERHLSHRAVAGLPSQVRLLVDEGTSADDDGRNIGTSIPATPEEASARAFAVIGELCGYVHSYTSRLRQLAAARDEFAPEFGRVLSAASVDRDIIAVAAEAGKIARALPVALAVAPDTVTLIDELESMRKRVRIIPFSVLGSDGLGGSALVDRLDQLLGEVQGRIERLEAVVVPAIDRYEPHLRAGIAVADRVVAVLGDLGNSGVIADELAALTQEVILGGVDSALNSTGITQKVEDVKEKVFDFLNNTLDSFERDVGRAIGTVANVMREADQNITRWLAERVSGRLSRVGEVIANIDDAVDTVAGATGIAKELADLFVNLANFLGSGSVAQDVQTAAAKALAFITDVEALVLKVQRVVGMVDAMVNMDSDTTLFAGAIDRIESFAVDGIADALDDVRAGLLTARAKLDQLTDFKKHAATLLDRAYAVAGDWLADRLQPLVAPAASFAADVRVVVDGFEQAVDLVTTGAAVQSAVARVTSVIEDLRTFITGFEEFHEASEPIWSVIDDARVVRSRLESNLAAAQLWAEQSIELVAQYWRTPCAGGGASCHRSDFFVSVNAVAERLAALERSLCAIKTIDEALGPFHDALDFFAATERLFGRFIVEAEKFLAKIMSDIDDGLNLSQTLAAAVTFADDVANMLAGAGNFVDDMRSSVTGFGDVVEDLQDSVATVSGEITISSDLLQSLGVNLGPLQSLGTQISNVLGFLAGAELDMGPIRAFEAKAADWLKQATDSGFGRDLFDFLELHQPKAQAIVDVISWIDDKILSLVRLAAEVATGISVDPSDLTPWAQSPGCTAEFCLRQEDRAGVVYRTALFPGRYTFFWDHTSAALIGQNDVTFRWTVPGLFEDYSPGGVSWIDVGGDKYHVLLSMRPTGSRLPADGAAPEHPSLFVVLNSDGEVIKFIRLFVDAGEPFVGRVSDVTLAHEYIWTCDDTILEDGRRNGQIIAFEKDDVMSAISAPGISDVSVARSQLFTEPLMFQVDAKASVLFFNRSFDADGDTLWVGETYTPAGENQPEMAVSAHHQGSGLPTPGWIAGYRVNGAGVPNQAFRPRASVDGFEVLVPDRVLYVGGDVTGFAAFDMLGYNYVAVSRSNYLSGNEASIDFYDQPEEIAGQSYGGGGGTVSAMTLPVDKALAMRVPAGVTSLGYDGHNYLITAFDSATNARIEDVARTQGDIEDSIFRLRRPVLRNTKPGITENTIFFKFLGAFVYGPECLINIGDECEDEDDRRRRLRRLGASMHDSVAGVAVEAEVTDEAARRRALEVPGAHRVRRLTDGCLSKEQSIFNKEVTFFEFSTFFVIGMRPSHVPLLLSPPLTRSRDLCAFSPPSLVLWRSHRTNRSVMRCTYRPHGVLTLVLPDCCRCRVQSGCWWLLRRQLSNSVLSR